MQGYSHLFISIADPIALWCGIIIEVLALSISTYLLIYDLPTPLWGRRCTAGEKQQQGNLPPQSLFTHQSSTWKNKNNKNVVNNPTEQAGKNKR